MSDLHESLVGLAIDAIKEVFSDQSVSQGETKRSLQSLADEIEVMMDTLEDMDDVLDNSS